MFNKHQLYMSRCLDLAKNGEGRVAPNPMVGAVVVYNDQIIGEGYHTMFGAPHAEVMAISNTSQKELLKQATLYVNLEPCCHYGKTPPCTQLIIDSGIPQVVIAAEDPFDQVNGGGIEILRQHGVDVIVGIMQNEALELNKCFYTYHQQKRPYIILKWAESLDGFIDYNPDQTLTPAKITGRQSQTLVHRWRSEVQAIMVGTNTVLRDNPQLTVRYWPGKNPLRVVIDRQQRIPPQAKVFDQSADTLLFVAEPLNTAIHYGDHVKIEVIDFKHPEQEILQHLYRRQIQSLFIEGGTTLLNSFIDKGLYDDIRLFIGNTYLTAGIKAPHKPSYKPFAEQFVGDDKLLVFRQKNK